MVDLAGSSARAVAGAEVIRVFSPATVPHVWRQTFALCAVAFWWMVVVYYGLNGFVWLVVQIGSWDWSFFPVTA